MTYCFGSSPRFACKSTLSRWSTKFSARIEARGARLRGPPSQQTPAKRWAALCLASHESGLPETPITSQPLFLIAVTVVFISAVSPLLEMQTTTSPGTSCPQEPCTASVPCRK